MQSDSDQPGSSWADEGARLMLAWQAGDEDAFDGLVRAYSDRVWALLTRFLGPVSAREDLVQEVFLRVIRARARYRAEARFSTWLYRIVFNLCANHRERAPRRASLSLDALVAASDGPGPFEPEAGADADPSRGLERADVVQAVQAAIAELPESQRMAVILARYEGLSFAEIGQVLDSTEKAVKSLVHRARERLRARLRPFLKEESA